MDIMMIKIPPPVLNLEIDGGSGLDTEEENVRRGRERGRWKGNE